MGAVALVSVMGMYVPDALPVSSVMKLLIALVLTLATSLATLLPIERWRWRVAPESFPPGTSVGQQVGVKVSALLLGAFAGSLAFAWVNARM